MRNGNTARRCVCWHQHEGRPCRHCTCPVFELAAVRILGREWAGATNGGPVCGSPFVGTSYRCGLTPHEWGRCHALDTTLAWHRQRDEAVA